MHAPSPLPEADRPDVEVSDRSFASAVIERSRDVPVLLDLWAPWCGPCRTLGPLLDQLATAYDGRFVLAKLNVDDNPQVAAALQARSIPQVVLFKDGRPVDQFVGALPESQIRAFLDRHLKPLAEGEQIRRRAAELMAVDTAGARQLLQQAIALDPALSEARLDLAASSLDLGEAGQALAQLEAVPVHERGERHAALLARARLAGTVAVGDADELLARLQADPKDFEAGFALATLRAREGRFGDAFAPLLEIVQRDRGEARERARAQLVEWFAICPDQAAVDRGRRLLGMYLH